MIKNYLDRNTQYAHTVAYPGEGPPGPCPPPLNFQRCDLKNKIKFIHDLQPMLRNYCLLHNYIMFALYESLPFLPPVNKLTLYLANSLLVTYFQILSTRVFKP